MRIFPDSAFATAMPPPAFATLVPFAVVEVVAVTEQ